MFRLSAFVEKEEKWHVAHCLELGIASQGKNIEEALANLKEAVELYIKHTSSDELERVKNMQKTNPIVTTFNVNA